MPRRMSPALKREFFNLPNLLTYLRVAAIPFVVLLLRLSDETMTNNQAISWGFCLATFFLFGAAAVTDWLDGWLARSRNQITLVGKFIDPIADKLIVLATLITLVELGRVDSWLVVLILLREISISGLRTLAMAEGLIIDVVQAGKIKTALQLVGIQCLILHYPIDLPYIDYSVSCNKIGAALVIISLFFSFFSAWIYFRGFVRAIMAKYEERDKT